MSIHATIGTEGPRIYFTGRAGRRPAGPVRTCRPPVAAPHPETDEGLILMRELLGRAGLDAASYRDSALCRRVPACLRLLGAAQVADARRLILTNPDLIPAAVDAVLLGVTEFYRDAEVFRYLEDQAIPGLLSENRALKVWSAACSSGQELYSAGMILERAGALEHSQLLGTDCRAEAIAEAMAGVYSVLPQGHHRLAGQGGGERAVRISDAVRSRIRWERQDLLTTLPEGVHDLILWRNMAIYLTPDAAAGIWHRLGSKLRPGGYLVSGKAEQPPREAGLIKTAPCIYRKPYAKEDRYGV